MNLFNKLLSRLTMVKYDTILASDGSVKYHLWRDHKWTDWASLTKWGARIPLKLMKHNLNLDEKEDFHKQLEETLGYEISDYAIEPQFENGEQVGLNVKVRPKTVIKSIKLDMCILSSGSKFKMEKDNGPRDDTQ